jgi:hypothetical protein
MKNILFLSILAAVALNSHAQTYEDCAAALVICNKDPLYFPFTGGTGAVTGEVDSTCLQAEFAPSWIKWTVATSGSFVFTITPDSPLIDLDFAVFLLNNSGNCDDKTTTRCMAAGENVGQPFPSWEVCTGATGLSFFETDTEEAPGCNNGNNNFLAALDCIAGETYALVINNFSNDGSGFRVEFCGDAVLPCDTIVCLPLGDNEQKKAFLPMKVFPNPAGDVINLELEAPAAADARFSVVNAQGVQVADGFHSVLPGLNNLTLPAAGLPAGMYFIRLEMKSGFAVARFIKQ